MQALEHPIEENFHPLSKSEFNLLYSLYAFPNIIIPLLGGIVIDKYGARIALMISAMFCVLGQLVWGFGGYNNTFAVMLVGRVVFGIGGEVLHASQNTLISSWFKASELSVPTPPRRWSSEFASPSPRWAAPSTPTSRPASPPTSNTTATT
jgi:MFS family permease